MTAGRLRSAQLLKTFESVCQYPPAAMESVLSVKLDRLTVGSILKQERSFLISVLLMRVQIRISHRPLHILLLEALPSLPMTNGRWMGIDNESNQVE